MERTLIIDREKIHHKLKRMAWQILEDHYRDGEVILVGIAERGGRIAKHLGNVISEISELQVAVHTIQLDKEVPLDNPIKCSISPDEYRGKPIILIDDVLNSGSTMMYAAGYFLQKPIKSLLVAVLVNRGHNRFPIHVDYVGMELSTTLQEHVTVDLDNEAVYLS